MSRRILMSLMMSVVACGNNAASVDPVRQKALDSPVCQATDAKAAFTNAICTCRDFTLQGAGFSAHSSAGQKTNVGVNGVDYVAGDHKVSGSMIAMKGFAGAGNIVTGTDLATAGDMLGFGRVVTGGNLMVGGRLGEIGVLQVKGTLGVADESQLIGWNQIPNRGAYVAPSEPCGCTTPVVDVLSRVGAARSSATHLDNTSSIGLTETTLKTGSYFVENFRTIGWTKITVDGAVALYVAGDFDQIGGEKLQLTQGSTLDIYVAGGLHSAGASWFGKHATPGSVRIYVGSEATPSFAVGAQAFNASVYAPFAQIALVGDTFIHGAIFGKDIAGIGLLDIDYVAPVAADPNKCAPPADPTTTTDPGAPQIN
jgi:hypothetical protein